MPSLVAVYKRYLPIITAATPGAFRIFVIVFSSVFVASDNMAIFSTEYTLAAFFVMICGVGFSTILVKSMAIAAGSAVFLSYALSSALIGGGVSLLLLFIFSFFVPVPDFLSVFLLVISTSLYQVFRNYLIFKKEFWKLLLNDILVGFFYLIIVVFWFLVVGVLEVCQIFVFLALAYFLAMGIVFFLDLKMTSEKKFSNGSVSIVSKENTISSLVIGMSNAASGGVSFILPSFFIALGGDDIAVIASVSALVFSSIAAVPRGIINNGTASLSKMVAITVFNRELVDDLRNKVRRIVIFLFPFLSVFILLYFYVLHETGSFLVTALFVAALGFYVATAQLGVVESVLINLCGYEKMALYFNVVIFIMIVMVFLISKFYSFGQYEFLAIYLLPIVLGVANIFRMFWYRSLVTRFFRNTD